MDIQRPQRPQWVVRQPTSTASTAGALSGPHTLSQEDSVSVSLWVLPMPKCFHFSHNLKKTKQH